MDNNIREIVSVVADVMAILGISGIFSWGIFKNGNDPLSETAYSIFTFAWKTAMVFLLFLVLLFFGGLFASLIGFLAELPYAMLVGFPYSSGSSSIPDVIGWIISGLLFIPLFIVLSNSIYQSSLLPIEKVIKRFSRNTDDKKDSK